MTVNTDKDLRAIREKIELLTGERSEGSRRAILLAEWNGLIQTMADQNASIQKRLTELSSQMGDSSASLTQELMTLASETTALAQAVSVLKTSLASSVAEIQDTRRAVSLGDMALAENIQQLSSTIGGNTAQIIEEKRTRTTADDALAQSISTLSATVTAGDNALSAQIQAEQTARANGDAANASSITSLSATVNGNSAAITTLQQATADIDSALSVLWSVQGTIDGVTGGLRLTGIKKADGTGAAYNLIIDANTTINGNLLVSGTVITDAAANNAFTEGVGSSGTWIAECDIVAKKAGDKFIVIGSYVGGLASAGAFSGAGAAGNLNFDLNYNATPFVSVPIRGFCYYVDNFFGAYTFYFLTTATTYMAVVTATAAGNHHFRVWTSNSTSLVQGVSIAAIRLSK